MTEDLKEKIAQVRVAIKRIEGFEKVGCDIAYSRLGAMHENVSAILDALEAAQRDLAQDELNGVELDRIDARVHHLMPTAHGVHDVLDRFADLQKENERLAARSQCMQDIYQDLQRQVSDLAQAIRECIEQTGVGLGSGEDLPDALRQIAQVVLLQRGNLELLEKQNADYRAGFDPDGCTAEEVCCGEIKGALSDKIDRLEKELEESRNKQEEYCYDLAAARKELAEVRGGRKVQLGVIEFHSERLNPGLTKRFYSVRDGLMATGAIVDLWLMNIASVLREFSYEMTIVSTSQPSKSTVTNPAAEPEVKP